MQSISAATGAVAVLGKITPRIFFGISRFAHADDSAHGANPLGA